jgi:hypothetical protein
MLEFQLGELAEKSDAHFFCQVLRMDFFPKSQEFKKGAASLDSPFVDHAAKRKKGHRSGGISPEGWGNIDPAFGIKLVDAFQGGFGLQGCATGDYSQNDQE